MMKNFVLSALFLSTISFHFNLSQTILSSSNQPENTKTKYQLSILSANKPVIKLYPKIRTEMEDKKVSSLPVDLLKTFMDYPTVIENDVIKYAPYIIGNSKNTYFCSLGDRIYADNIKEPGRYIIYRVSREITDPETGKSLGKEIIYNGEAKTITPRDDNKALVKNQQTQSKLADNERFSGARIFGKKAPPFVKLPTKMAQPLVITKVTSEISRGDKLLLVPENNHERFNFTPHPVADNFQAQIIHIFAGVAGQHIGKYQTILLNKGKVDGIDKGAIVSIYEKLPNKTWVDSANIKKIIVKNIAFPVNLVGKAMIYNVTNNLAYAVVIENDNNGYIQIGNFAAASGKDLEDIPEYEPKH